MNKIVNNHQATKDAEQYNAQRPADAGPWCECGDHRVPPPTIAQPEPPARCPVCVDTARLDTAAAVAAIGQSSRWGGHGFGRKAVGE